MIFRFLALFGALFWGPKKRPGGFLKTPGGFLKTSGGFLKSRGGKKGEIFKIFGFFLAGFRGF